jgi:predicted nucleic acid-binding protein
MTIYLDTCALNRLTDQLDQPCLRAEAQAIITIVELVQAQQVSWVASTLLAFEVSRNPSPYKRVFAESLLPPRRELISPSDSTLDRAAELTRDGLGAADALHLALAEQGSADWFITTDDGFSAGPPISCALRSASIL